MKYYGLPDPRISVPVEAKKITGIARTDGVEWWAWVREEKDWVLMPSLMGDFYGITGSTMDYKPLTKAQVDEYIAEWSGLE